MRKLLLLMAIVFLSCGQDQNSPEYKAAYKKALDKEEKEYSNRKEKAKIRDSLNKISIELANAKATYWSYSHSEDKMTNDRKVYAKINSLNQIDFEFPYQGGSSLELTIRYSNKKTEIILKISKGQFQSNYSDQSIKLKFDDEKPFNVNYSEPADGSSDLIFLNSEKKILSKLKIAKKLMIECPFYQEGGRVFDFNTQNLSWQIK